MSTIPMIVTPNSVSVFIDGCMRTINSTHINFDDVKTLLRQYQAATKDSVFRGDILNEIREMFDVRQFIAKVTAGRVQVSDDAVVFDGKTVHGVISTRLLEMLKAGFDIKPLARFLDRLSNNPDINARDEIYLFLESGHMPLTDDGCFLAFKRVKPNFDSFHVGPDGKIYNNAPGKIVEMDRAAVSRDRNAACAEGLHFCSWKYLPQYQAHGESKVVVLKVAPEDVVSIPYDYNNSKGRAWKYASLAEVPASETETLFNGVQVTNNYGHYDDRPNDDENEAHSGGPIPADEEYMDDTHDANCPCQDGIDGTADRVDGVDIPEWQEPPVIMDVLPSGNEPSAPTTELVFTYGKKGKKSITASGLKLLVTSYGQRGVSKMLEVPRSTIQGWLKMAERA